MKKIITYFFSCALTVVSGYGYSQTALFSWAGQMNTDSSGSSEIADMFAWSASTSSQFVTAGNFSGTVDMDLTAGQDYRTSQGGSDIWLALINEVSPTNSWAITIGSAGDEKITKIKQSDDFNILVAGSFSGTVDFDPGPGTMNLTSAGGKDGFLLKLDCTTGALIWALNVASGTGDDECTGLFVNALGEITIAGTFEGNADLDPGSNTATAISIGGKDIFVSKFSAAGSYNISTFTGGVNDENVYNVVIGHNGFTVVNGGFWGSMDVDPSANTQLINSSDTSMFIVSLDSSLSYNNHGSLHTPKYVSMIYDYSSLRIVMCGTYRDSLCREVSGTGGYIYSMGGWDGFILTLYDHLNFTATLYRVGGTGDDLITASGILSSRLAIAGTTTSAQFTFLETPSDTFQSIGSGNDMFAASIEYYSGTIDNSGLAENNNALRNVKAALPKFSAQGFGLMMAGDFSGTCDYNPEAGVYNLSSNLQNVEGFATRWAPCATIYTGTSVFTCDSIYIYNNIAYPVPGTISDTFQTACGADSIINISLVHATIDPTVTASNLTLTAAQSGIAYQWVDCNAGYAPIIGATSQSFTPAVAGSYAVILTAGWCSVPDTSACTSVDVGISENNLANVSATPNPFSTQIIIDNLPAQSHVSIFNSLGQIVYNANSDAQEHIVNTTHLPSGVYMMHVQSSGMTSVIRLIK
jgi:hypothetical protein